MKQTSIAVKIGSFNVTYFLFVTSAPPAYDGGGTFTIYGAEGEKNRYILVPAENVAWQIGRNGSGLYYTTPCDEIPEGTLRDKLYGRLLVGAT